MKPVRTKIPHAVRGVSAPGVRLTPFGAALLAAVIAIPSGILIGLVDWLI